MRILILNERDPRHPRAGGAETHVHEVFRRLAARGHAVTALVSSFRGGGARDEIDGIRFERVGALPTYYASAIGRCIRATRRGEFDVVVECLNKMPYLAPLYSARPVLGLCHHLFGETAFLQVAWPIAAAVCCVERAIPRAYRRAQIVAISASTRDDLIARGIAPGRVDVQHPGVRHAASPELPIDRRGPLVAYVGRLEAYKRIGVLLEAIAALSARLPDVQLALVGRGSERARLQRRAAELGIAGRVAFTGFVADAERDGWLARSRVCVCASIKEGFGLSVIEANAVGTPNVVSDAPGLREAVRDGETGFVVGADDAAGFAGRIESLLCDDALALRMSRAALAWSRRFDWETAADAMERSLERTLERGA